jgi:hypothetical protein
MLLVRLFVIILVMKLDTEVNLKRSNCSEARTTRSTWRQWQNNIHGTTCHYGVPLSLPILSSLVLQSKWPRSWPKVSTRLEQRRGAKTNCPTASKWDMEEDGVWSTNVIQSTTFHNLQQVSWSTTKMLVILDMDSMDQLQLSTMDRLGEWDTGTLYPASSFPV